jgi:hypothetical protein
LATIGFSTTMREMPLANASPARADAEVMRW